MSIVNNFSYAGLSDKGNRRNINEDAFKACPEIGLWIVADGMGGHEGGDIASQLAVKNVGDAVKNGFSLEEAIQQVHVDILQLSSSGNGKIGMGTTIVAAQIIGTDFKIAWVGDSRAYLFDDSQLTQLSRDHTLVQQLIDSGEISEAQSRIHPQRNVINQALGGYESGKREIGIATGKLNKGILLLCSDGLSGELMDDKINTVLSEKGSLEMKAKKLIASVLALEGFDNITVLLISK